MSDQKNTRIPDALTANVKIIKNHGGVDGVGIYLSDINSNKVASFQTSSEMAEWLSKEGFVYFTGSQGIWVKAPKVPNMEKVV